MPLITMFLPGGQATKLQVFVSARGIVCVLEDAHCLPLFAALDIFPLVKYENYGRLLGCSCTLSFFCCPHHMWQSKQSMIPTARHHSQLKMGTLLIFQTLNVILYQEGTQPHCKCLSLQEVLCASWRMRTVCRCLLHLLFFPWSNIKIMEEFGHKG